MKTSQFTKLDSMHWNTSNIFAVCHWINRWHTAAILSDFSFTLPSNFIPAPYLSFIWRSFTSWLWRHCFRHIILYISAVPFEGATASRSILEFSDSDKLDKYCFTFLISRLRCIIIIKLRLRSVSIMLLLQIRSDDLMRSVVLCVVVDM
jgi:hypothetical protein